MQLAWYEDPEQDFEFELELYPELRDDDEPAFIGDCLEINGLECSGAILYTKTGRELFITSDEPLPNVGRIVEFQYETERKDTKTTRFHHEFKKALIVTKMVEPRDYEGLDGYTPSENSNYHIYVEQCSIHPSRGFQG